jgi:hypothetical protein
LLSSTPADTLTWVYDRHGERLTIQRDENLTLTVTGSGEHDRAYSFENVQELVGFQAGFERHLIGSGWSLVSFSPERRRGVERRAIPRKTERRRTIPRLRRS